MTKELHAQSRCLLLLFMCICLALSVCAQEKDDPGTLRIDAVDRELENLAQARQKGDKIEIAELYNKIAYLYWENNAAKEAGEYFEQSRMINEELGNLNGLLTLYASLGLVAIDETNYDKSMFYFQKSYQLALELGDEKIQSESLLNMGQSLLRLKRYDEAVEVVEKLVAHSKEQSNYRLLRVCYGRLADLYKAKGDAEKAYKYVELYTSFNTYELKQQASMLKDASHKLQQTKTEMVNARKQLLSKDDELAQAKEGIQKMAQMARAKQMEVDLLLKDRIIQDLKIREQQAQLRFEKILRMVLIVGLLLISIFGFTVYMLYVKIKDKDKRIRENTHVFVELFRQAHDAFVLIESDRISDCNNAFVEISSYCKTDDLIGRRLVDCFEYADVANKRIEIEQAIVKSMKAGKSSVDLEVKNLRGVFFVRLLFNGFMSSQGKLVFVLFNDLSFDKRKETELIHSKNSLKELVLEKTYELEDVKLVTSEKDRINSMMLSGLGSELRSPLNAILGVSKVLLANEYVDEKVTEALTVVNESATMMKKAVDDWFENAELAPADKRLNLLDLDTKIFVSAVEKLIRESLPDGYGVEFKTSPAFPSSIRCDINVKQIYARIVKYLTEHVGTQMFCFSLYEDEGKVFSELKVHGEVDLPEVFADINEYSVRFPAKTQQLFKPLMHILKKHGGALKSTTEGGETKISFFFVDGKRLEY